jgi:hypothetical protein
MTSLFVCSSMIEDHGYQLQNVCEHLRVHGLKLCTWENIGFPNPK